MPNVFINAECTAFWGDYVDIACRVLIQFGDQIDITLQIPQTLINSNPSTVNNAIVDALKTYLSTNHGVTIGPGDKVMLFGGVV